eukprot:TRINITY_DN2050_c1_g1_i1.p2 TRINITY_DN2050_c1_g1~~TRINITY_DN2050_c1_g1_i1.p2  ORF type:complete len:313 (+),score=83.55 TRINITY_DN2050_c1_g1_i1:74-940(+)
MAAAAGPRSRPSFQMLPADVLDCVGAYGCSSWREWLRLRAVSPHFNDVEWYRGLGLGDLVVVPSPQAGSVQDALTIVDGLDGLVVLLPGVYREGVRITKDVTIVGWSPNRGACVIESHRWEPCVQFVGLGRSVADEAAVIDPQRHWAPGAPDSRRTLIGTGEKAALRNLTLRTRSQQQRCAITVVRGCPSVRNCDIAGSVWVSGESTDPVFEGCAVRCDASVGVRVTDHARGRFVGSTIFSRQSHGMRIDRGARPQLEGTRVHTAFAEAVCLGGESDSESEGADYSMG